MGNEGKDNITRSSFLRMSGDGVRVLSEENRKVELSFSSEQPYDRWFGSEVLCHDEGAVDLARLEETGSLLFHHGRDPKVGYIPVGRLEEVRLDDDKRCRAVVSFDEDDNSELIYQKVKSGAIRGISVGYRILAVEEVKANAQSSNGRFNGPCTVATRWQPYEISIEPTPADSSVGVGRSAEQEITVSKGENGIMAKESTKTLETQESGEVGTRATATAGFPLAQGGVIPLDTEAIRSEAVQAERTRSAEITALCRDFGLDPVEFLSTERSVDEVRALVLNRIKAGELGQKAIPAGNSVEVTADEEDRYRSAARDGLLQRMGFTVEHPSDGSREFRGMSLRSLAQNCLLRQEGSGTDMMRMDDEELLRSALGFDLSRGTLVPDSAFVSIVNNTIGSVLSRGYATANTTFQFWTGRGSNPNFKTAKRFRLSAAGEMVEVQQNGEFKADTVTDEGVDTQLRTFGKKFGFTRQAFINDDLGTLAKAIQAQARSAKRTINKQVYKLLGEAATKYSLDSKALFHADHKNLGTPLALSVDSLGELYRLMSLQTDLSGKEQLNIQPKFGLFPVALSIEARRLLNSLADPEANHSGVINPVQGLVTPIFEAELDKYSSTTHYIAADPNDVDTIEVGYLNGKEEPTLESQSSWEKLGIEYRMYHDWYTALLDFRGLAKNAGK